MTSMITQPAATVRSFLLGDGPDGDGVLRRALSTHDVLDRCTRTLGALTRESRQLVDDELASAVAGLLEVDVGDVVLAAWRTHHRLAEAAGVTLAAPGRQEIVQLGAHRVTSTHHPTIDLLVDGVRVHTFRFRLTVVVDIDVAAAVVEEGRLVAVKAGDSTLTASLSLAMPGGDVELVHRHCATDLHVLLRLDHGVRLREAGRPAAAAYPTATAEPTGCPG